MDNQLGDANQLGEDVRALLQRKADEFGLGFDVPGAVRRARRRLARNAVVMLVVATLVATGTVAGIRSLNLTRNPKPAQTPTLPPAGSVSARIPLPPYPAAVSAGEGAVWVASSPRFQINPEDLPPANDLTPYPAQGPEDPRASSPPAVPSGTVTRIDPATNQVTAAIEVGGNPYDLVAAYGAVWVADAQESRALRIDPGTTETTTISVPTPVASVTAAAGSVWFTSYGDPSMFRVDPDTAQVIAVIEVGDAGYKEVRSFHDTIWVGYDSNLRFAQIDPATNRVGTEVRALETNTSAYGQFAVGDRPIWVASGDLFLIDPTTDRVMATISLQWRDLPPNVSVSEISAIGAAEDGYTGVIATPHGVWVSVSGVLEAKGEPSRVVGRLLRIDLLTNQVSGLVQIENPGTGTELFAMTATQSSIWVIDRRAHQLVRLDVEGP
ncbi:MAG TPA: hypothetical protein VGL18_03990 [Actinomycetota bacterium]|jgi:YVTN family beta-propeller protein